jgi:hypothetical protein
MKIYGIYSFPKSGNTWVRNILAGAIKTSSNYSEVVPDVYESSIWKSPIVLNGEESVIYKSHSKDELRQNDGKPVHNDGIVYIIRHPLDVFSSQLNYVSDNVTSNPNIMLPCASVDDVIEKGNMDLFLGAFSTFGTLQPGFADAGSWFVNAGNWLARAEAEPDRVVIVRYEDMLEFGPSAFEPALKLMGIPLEDLTDGFTTAKKNTAPDGKFFWKQKAGTHKDILSQEMIDRFMETYADHPAVSLYT